MREEGLEGGPRETGRLTLKRVGVNLLSASVAPWLSMLLRIVACEGERLLLAWELRPDKLDKLAKSFNGELERLFGYESWRLRTGMRDMESRRIDNSEGVSR